jgi:hypothetical protein
MKVAIYQRHCTTPEDIEQHIQDQKDSLPNGYVPVAVFVDLDCQSTDTSAFSQAWDFVNQGHADALYVIPAAENLDLSKDAARMEETTPALLFPSGAERKHQTGQGNEDN